jgi:hypothetical protein
MSAFGGQSGHDSSGPLCRLMTYFGHCRTRRSGLQYAGAKRRVVIGADHQGVDPGFSRTEVAVPFPDGKKLVSKSVPSASGRPLSGNPATTQRPIVGFSHKTEIRSLDLIRPLSGTKRTSGKVGALSAFDLFANHVNLMHRQDRKSPNMGSAGALQGAAAPTSSPDALGVAVARMRLDPA